MRRVLTLILLAAALVLVPRSPSSATTVDGLFDGRGPLVAKSPVDLTVVGRGGVPATGVGSVALNVTVTRPTASGFLTVWPAGAARPLASNLNFVPGQTVPNMVVVPVGTDGRISLYSSAGLADVVVDVLGWFPETASFHGLSPARLMDTRSGSPTVDGASAGGGPIVADADADVLVRGRGGVPSAGVGSVALNVTLTNPTAPGFLTVWPSATPRPTASTLNAVAGQTVPNMVIVPLGADGRISLSLFAGAADVVVDALGWFPTGASFTGSIPTRLMDTRPGSPTIDGAFAGTGPLAAATPRNLALAGRGGVPPAGTGSVALNVTVTGPTASGFLTVWPAGAPRPTASNLNFAAGRTVANMVVVPLGEGGQISLYSLAGEVDVIVDVLGWFPDGPSFTGLNPGRLMDTRRAPPPPGSDPQPTFPIRGAFYYPWFPGSWKQSGIFPYTNYSPSAGYYNGADAAVVEQQIEAMRYGNIEMGISSWWGPGTATDARLPTLLDAADGTPFRWSVYYEAESLGDPSVEALRADLQYLVTRYGSDPSALRIDGRFVVFVYADGADGCAMADRWKAANTVGAYVVLKVFAGYAQCVNQPDEWHQYGPGSAASGQGVHSYSISPGFWHYGQPVRLGRDLDRWAQSVRDMVASGARFQLVTTFNEWGEGTSVESADQWPSASGYGSYLDILHGS